MDWSKALESAVHEVLTLTANDETKTEPKIANATTTSHRDERIDPNDQSSKIVVVAIGIAGQMHGEVLVDSTAKCTRRDICTGDDKSNSHNTDPIGAGMPVGPVRLWCDGRNQKEADELSTLFSIPYLPKRLTAARWLWTIRNRPDLARRTDFLTTPAGYLAFQLTNTKVLGIGDASGMFPMDSETLNYRQDLLHAFDSAYKPAGIPSLSQLLPKVATCGQSAGELSHEAAKWLGLPAGIPVAAAEGDQPAALVGSLIGQAGMISCSFGTSVCANVVGGSISSEPSQTTTTSSHQIQPPSCANPIESAAINHFCAVNGQPIYMVWLRNGTTFFNSMVRSYGGVNGSVDNDDDNNDDIDDNAFQKVMPKVLAAPPDCGGLLALPFMDDEPGMGVHKGGTATIIGWNPSNATAHGGGNACKAALLSTMFNLLKGTNYLKEKGVPMTEILLSGGLTKTPECGQIVADVFGLPVKLLGGSDEGCAWGAAILAKYRWEKLQQRQGEVIGSSTLTTDANDWVNFLETIQVKPMQSFQPNSTTVPTYQELYQRYLKLLAIQSELQKVVS